VLILEQEVLSMAVCVTSPFCVKLHKRPFTHSPFPHQTTNFKTIPRFHHHYWLVNFVLLLFIIRLHTDADTGHDTDTSIPVDFYKMN